MDRKIEIVKYPPERGRKIIYVDNKPWGIVIMVGHGCHGPSYEFNQIDNIKNVLSYDPISDPKSYKGKRIFEVRPRQKFSKWANEPKPPTADEAILAKAKLLIADGMLRDPLTVQNEREREARKWLRDRERLGRERRASDERRVDVILKAFVGDNVRAALVSKLADLIETCRSE